MGCLRTSKEVCRAGRDDVDTNVYVGDRRVEFDYYIISNADSDGG